MTVVYKPNRKWSYDLKKGLNLGLLEIVTTIDARAKILAPKQSRNLVNSGKITPVSGGYKVSFGSSKVPYARRRHFENFKTPSSVGYLAKAGDSVARGEKSKYFRNKVGK